jgi:acetyltransferase-like isoleucine patch superfamily enzyme
MSLLSSIKNRWFLHVMHSGDEKKKEKFLRKTVAHIGKNCRIYSDSFGTEPWLLWFGDNVIVASGAVFIEHDASYYTAYRLLGEKADPETEKMGGIVVEDNCFIGANAIVLGGTRIGRDSIIAAGAVVHGIIPSGEVWGGVPAKFIMKTKEYALKVKKNTEELPWCTLNKDEKKRATGLNNLEIKKDYYFSKLEDKDI